MLYALQSQQSGADGCTSRRLIIDWRRLETAGRILASITRRPRLGPAERSTRSSSVPLQSPRRSSSHVAHHDDNQPTLSYRSSTVSPIHQLSIPIKYTSTGSYNRFCPGIYRLKLGKVTCVYLQLPPTTRRTPERATDDCWRPRGPAACRPWPRWCWCCSPAPLPAAAGGSLCRC